MKKLLLVYLFIPGGMSANILQEVSLTVISHRRCQGIYSRDQKEVTDKMFCALAHGRGTCLVSSLQILRGHFLHPIETSCILFFIFFSLYTLKLEKIKEGSKWPLLVQVVKMILNFQNDYLVVLVMNFIYKYLLSMSMSQILETWNFYWKIKL